MRKTAKTLLLVGLFFQFGLFGWSETNVRLRIYLNDGSLQSGNFVKETEGTFIILSKSGRQEIEKSKIMFINGKTLTEWQKRPDRLFQTEIIPDKIPDPVYVNDKAALPAPPKIEPVKPLPAAPVATAPPETKPVEKEPEEKPEPEPVVQTSPAPKEAVSPKRVEKKKPAPKTVVKKVEKPKRARSRRSPLFSRRKSAELHFKRAKGYLAKGLRGHAISQLHFATVLDRRNEKAALLLGQLYKDERVFDRARQEFSHPGLKKHPRLETFLKEMKQTEDRNKRERIILFASAFAGVMSSVPLVIALRKIRARPGRRVIDSETLEVEPESSEDLAIQSVRKRLENLKKESVPEPADEFAEEEVSLAAPDVPAPSSSRAPPQFHVEKPEPPPREPEPASVEPEPPLIESEPQAIESMSPPVESAPPPVELEPPSVESQPPPIRVEPAVRAPEPMADIEPEQPPPEAPQPPAVPAGLMEDLLAKGIQSCEKEDWPQAERAYRTLLLVQSDRLEGHLGLAYIHFVQERWERALEHYLRAVRIDPNNADARYGLGRSYLELNDEERAVGELRRCLELDSTMEDARETLTFLGRAV